MEATVAQVKEVAFGSVLSAYTHRTRDKQLLIYEHINWVEMEKLGFPNLN